ncbi:DNA-binding helix-turn-helix protein [[Bacteroides] pectinophilus ATCC 43243]|uniref:HTH cro/C1-type domain-containing protein n=1 Tax=[Bacteroides] pectinophilus ATCC 43243 TaxID=483218 RepID=B7ANJ0_9FIRM|nr:DNA-binding helix-turn-helix protein [[Bacteroides] pectinophilus ATCC 43243]
MQISFLFVSRGGKEEYMYYDIKESGKRLSELRKMKGLTQQQVADELGIDVDTVRKNEQGRRGLSIDTASMYAEYYHSTIDYITHGKESSNDEVTAMLAEYPEEVRNKAAKLLKNILDTLAE